MPVFRVTYTTALTDHAVIETIEWVTELNWDTTRTRRDFQERFPGAAVVQCREVEFCC